MTKIAPRPDRGVKDTPVPATIPTFKLPQSAPDGTIMTNAAKYSRNAVLSVYEMIGGTVAFAEWAEMNRTDFYKTMFGKTIQRDVEVGVTDDVESLLERLDAKKQVKSDEMTIDAEFEMVGDAYDNR